MENSEVNNKSEMVAIFGASGFIGMRLVSEIARSQKCRIKVLTRTPKHFSSLTNVGVEVAEGDLLKPDSLKGFLESGCIVINLAYLSNADERGNLAATKNLLEICREENVRRLVHCSTADVVGRAEDNPVTENTACQPVTSYGVTKLKIENLILDEGAAFDIAILRPTAVFGPGGKNLNKLSNEIISGSRLVNYVKLCLFGDRRMNLVPVANVVNAIIFLAFQNEDVGSEIFIVSEDDCLINNFASVEKLLMMKFRIKDYRLPIVPLSLGLLAFFLKTMGKDNANPRRNYSSNKLRNKGFKSVVSLESALEEYATWYRASRLSKT